MTKITDILDRSARECGVEPPDSWLTAVDLEYQEIRDDFLFQTVDDLLERADWPNPIGAQTTITGTGDETYTLPASYRRLNRSTFAVQETTDNLRRRIQGVKSSGDWTYLKDLDIRGLDRFFLIQGVEGSNTISFFPELETGATVVVSWVSDQWITNSGTQKYEFTDALDQSLFHRRLIETGIVARYRERHGLPFENKAAEHNALVARHISDIRQREPISQVSKYRRSEGLSQYGSLGDGLPVSITTSGRLFLIVDE